MSETNEMKELYLKVAANMQGIRAFRGDHWPLETLHIATSHPPGNVSFVVDMSGNLRTILMPRCYVLNHSHVIVAEVLLDRALSCRGVAFTEAHNAAAICARPYFSSPGEGGTTHFSGCATTWFQNGTIQGLPKGGRRRSMPQPD